MVTIKDVARLAGTSVSTVSHVLNGTRVVSDELRQRVEAIIAESNFVPSSIARSLVTSSTKMIGVAVSWTANSIFSTAITVIDDDARSEGYSLLVADSRDDPDLLATAIRSLIDRRVDGVILAPVGQAGSSSWEALDDLAARSIPTVLIDRQIPGNFDSVVAENEMAMEDLVGHLLDRGHTRIGYLQGNSDLPTSFERLKGVQSALAGRGLAFEGRFGNSTVDGGRRASLELFDAGVTAIVSGNNNMTLGAYYAAHERGLSIPSDIALCGYDDFPFADLLEPPLTAVSQPMAKMGRIAMKLLQRRIKHPDAPVIHERLDTTFVHRRSCGCLEES